MKTIPQIKDELHNNFLINPKGIFSAIKKYLPKYSKKYKTLLLLESRDRDIEKRRNQGVISSENYELQKNTIRLSLLTLIDDFQERDFDKKILEKKNIFSLSSYRNKFFTFFLVFIFAGIFVMNSDFFSEKEENKKPIAEIEELFKKFIDSWTNKNLSDMTLLLDASFYYEDRKEKQKRSAFIKEKKKLFVKHDWIRIDTSQTKITFFTGNYQKGVIEYKQEYKTPTYRSIGINKLYFARHNNSYKIIKEEFSKN